MLSLGCQIITMYPDVLFVPTVAVEIVSCAYTDLHDLRRGLAAASNDNNDDFLSSYDQTVMPLMKRASSSSFFLMPLLASRFFP